MKESNILVVGSCCCDIILNVPHLPTRTEDISIHTQTMQLGGCAFNVAYILQLLHTNYQLLSPIGSGIYGDFVYDQLEKHHMHSIIERQTEPNGCCYCFVEEDGERTFLSYHGIEYYFKKAWFQQIQAHPNDAIYICGLEIEEDHNHVLIDWLQSQTATIYFAPGPRILHIDKATMETIFSFHPILHLNQQEAFQYSHKSTILDACETLYKKTLNDVIITCGEKGSYLYDGTQLLFEKTDQVNVKNTIGAGDSHIATYIAMRYHHKTKQEALRIANKIASKVVTSTDIFININHA